MSLILSTYIDEVEKINHRVTGKLVRQERERCDIKLRALAKACGWSPAYMSQLERGLTSWNKNAMARVRAALKKVRGK
jgi:transcriptional regulator with XRE-family HTH domain